MDSQFLMLLISASASGAPSIRKTSTPIDCSRFVSASATPPLSGISTTREPGPRATPVGLQIVSDGRKTGTGTRRGMLFAASKASEDAGAQPAQE